MTLEEFNRLRYGMFVHFGLYSRLGRGEWVMNRERLDPEEMRRVASEFNPVNFDAEALCDLALAGGMKYIIFTTMHHDGFRLYDTALSDHNSMKICGRDFTAEIVAAARRRGLKIGLYHSLNNWFDQPDAVAAWDDPGAYEVFIAKTFARLRELVEKFRPFDILWYDGWWPFDADGWQAERMNAAMRELAPNLLFNGRNGLPGDFGTPEQHLSAPSPWRPWEACVTLNDHWGYHRADANWKGPVEVIKMLLTCANGKGNLLLNIGPDGSGAVPEESRRIVAKVGDWLASGGNAAVTDTELFRFGFGVRTPEELGDWDHNGVFTSSGRDLFFTMLYCPGAMWRFNGLEAQVEAVSWNGVDLVFRQSGDVVEVDLPGELQEGFCPVLKISCDRRPSLYRPGGMGVPKKTHPRYDPVEPDLLY